MAETSKTCPWGRVGRGAPSTSQVPRSSEPRAPRYRGDGLAIALFDAFGHKLLSTKLFGDGSGVTARFDELRLGSGDYLFAWFASGASGRGTSHSRIFPGGSLPASPKLDDLIHAPSVADPFESYNKPETGVG